MGSTLGKCRSEGRDELWIPFHKANSSVLSIAYFNCVSGVWRFGTPSFSMRTSHVLASVGHSRVVVVDRVLMMTWRVLRADLFAHTGWLMRLQLPRSLEPVDSLDNLQWELAGELETCAEDFCFCEGFGDTLVFGESVWVCGIFGLYCDNRTYVFGVARFALDGFAPQSVAYVSDEFLYATAGAVGPFGRFGHD